MLFITIASPNKFSLSLPQDVWWYLGKLTTSSNFGKFSRTATGEEIEGGKDESGESQSLFISVGAGGTHQLDFLLYSSPHHLLHSEDMDIQNTPPIARNCQDSLVAQLVKNLPAMQETWVRLLGQEGLLEKEIATQSSILAWEIPRTEEPGRLQSMGLQRVRQDLATEHNIEHTIVVSTEWFCNNYRLIHNISLIRHNSCATAKINLILQNLQ